MAKFSIYTSGGEQTVEGHRATWDEHVGSVVDARGGAVLVVPLEKLISIKREPSQ